MARSRRAVSSAVEHCLHTAGVTSSILVPPTTDSETGLNGRFRRFRTAKKRSVRVAAGASHGRCHKFDPCTAHHRFRNRPFAAGFVVLGLRKIACDQRDSLRSGLCTRSKLLGTRLPQRRQKPSPHKVLSKALGLQSRQGLLVAFEQANVSHMKESEHCSLVRGQREAVHEQFRGGRFGVFLRALFFLGSHRAVLVAHEQATRPARCSGTQGTTKNLTAAPCPPLPTPGYQGIFGMSFDHPHRKTKCWARIVQAERVVVGMRPLTDDGPPIEWHGSALRP